MHVLAVKVDLVAVAGDGVDAFEAVCSVSAQVRFQFLFPNA